MKKANRIEVDPPLQSWQKSVANGGSGTGAREDIIAFVEAAILDDGPGYIEVEDRIAVFDNDGTLWGEQPEYVQAPFIGSRPEAAEPGFTETIAEYHQAVLDWLATARHPNGSLYTDLVYQPMLELLAYLRHHRFKTFIVSGGGIEFVRPWANAVYGIPPEQVVGSSVKTAYQQNPPAVLRLTDLDPATEYQESIFIDDRDGKVVGINQHIGRRPVAAFGNSDGDLEMLRWTEAGDGPRFGLILHHTDGVREYNYVEVEAAWDPDAQLQNDPSGHLSQSTIDLANQNEWTVVDMALDWSFVYPSDLP